MNLLSMLPILKGWIYKPVDIDVVVTVPAGETHEIQEEGGRGWLQSAMISLDQPEAELVIEQEHGYGIFTATARPKALFDAGLTLPNATGFFCSRYDTVLNVYVVNYLPALPVGYNRKSRTSLRAVNTTHILNYASVTVKIYNYAEFMKSLHEALGVKGVK